MESQRRRTYFLNVAFLREPYHSVTNDTRYQNFAGRSVSSGERGSVFLTRRHVRLSIRDYWITARARARDSRELAGKT